MHGMAPSRAENPAERVIRRFGGQSALAGLLGKRQSTIEHWASTGRIPAQWHQPLMSLARQRGVVLEAKDFVDTPAQPHRPGRGPPRRPARRPRRRRLDRSSPASSTRGAAAASPIGSLTQMGTIRLGKRTENRMPLIKDFVPLAGLDQLVFGAWDPFPDNAYEAALKCGVLDRHEHIEPIADFLKTIKPMPAVFDHYYVKRLDGTNVKHGRHQDGGWPRRIRQDIRDFKAQNDCDRLVMVWCASTEIFMERGAGARRTSRTSRRRWRRTTRRSRPRCSTPTRR